MTEKREPNPINKITFDIISDMVDETEMLKKLKDDWGFIRHPRSHPDRDVTFKLPKNIFYIAIITSPEKWKGKIAGYCGIGISDDLLIDSGAYTLGGPAAGVEREGYAVDVRDNKVYTQLREKRNDAAESLSKDKGIPFLVLLKASRAANYYMGRGYIEHSQNIPEWAIKTMEKFPDKEWYVYNENDAAMKKAWDILKRGKLSQTGRNLIDNAMSDGEERTAKMILDRIHTIIEETKSSYYSIPTPGEIQQYLKSQTKYVIINRSKKGNSYILKKSGDILKGKRMNSRAEPIIDKIMAHGKERTAKEIIDELYDYIENHNKGTGQKLTFQIVPSPHEMASYLIRNNNYINRKIYLKGKLITLYAKEE